MPDSRCPIVQSSRKAGSFCLDAGRLGAGTLIVSDGPELAGEILPSLNPSSNLASAKYLVHCSILESFCHWLRDTLDRKTGITCRLRVAVTIVVTSVNPGLSWNSWAIDNAAKSSAC